MGGSYSRSDQPDGTAYRKDASLDQLATTHNVAQFVSFAPSSNGPRQQFCRIAGLEANHQFETPLVAVETLLSRSPEAKINVRSFSAEQSQSREFIYGVEKADDAIAAVERMTNEGAFTIVNETIDISDGGVSGVVIGDVVEFRPDMTPRGVEKPGFARLPLRQAIELFKAVYGIDVDFSHSKNGRLEFSLHPKPRGWKLSNILFWEYAEDFISTEGVKIDWPNDFSRMVGDKAYGLLMAAISGFPVPETTVISRRVAPFSFGRPTGLVETWIRTSPREQVPGKFTTSRGWQDPFALLQAEDPGGTSISSVLSQQGISALWSGAALETSSGNIVVEGVKGNGNRFMVGLEDPDFIPESVVKRVRDLSRRLRDAFGPTRFEWVFDGDELWIVQLHSGASVSDGDIIVPGDAEEWIDFEVRLGLEALRSISSNLGPRMGITLDKRIGLTSHLADVLRKAGVPARVRVR